MDVTPQCSVLPKSAIHGQDEINSQGTKIIKVKGQWVDLLNIAK